MPDFPFRIDDATLQAALEAAMDREGKIPRAISELGSVADRDVLVLAADRGIRAAQLTESGGRVTTIDGLDTSSRPPASANAIASFWSGFAGDAEDFDAQTREAERVLRPGGRILAVHHYGRDDASMLLLDEERRGAVVSWSNRHGPFLRRGFKIRVLHAWWSFDSLDEARSVLSGAFGARGEALAVQLRRPRLSHKVAVYHRGVGET